MKFIWRGSIHVSTLFLCCIILTPEVLLLYLWSISNLLLNTFITRRRSFPHHESWTHQSFQQMATRTTCVNTEETKLCGDSSGRRSKGGRQVRSGPRHSGPTVGHQPVLDRQGASVALVVAVWRHFFFTFYIHFILWNWLTCKAFLCNIHKLTTTMLTLNTEILLYYFWYHYSDNFKKYRYLPFKK